MDEFFIYIVHNIIQYNVAKALLFVVIKIFHIVVDVVKDFLQMSFKLGLML